jgi:hypothetical protein
MATASIEELQNRIAILEAQVAQLLSRNKGPIEKDWRKTLGMFTGDEVMQDNFNEALRARDAEREAVRMDRSFDEESK